MKKFPFRPFCRYEVEYDENRLTTALDIGSRFLDIDVHATLEILNNGNAEDAAISDDGAVTDALNSADGIEQSPQQTTSIDDDLKSIPITTATNPIETEICNNTTANNISSSSCSNNHKNFQHLNGDEHGRNPGVTYDGDGGGGSDVGDGGGGENNADDCAGIGSDTTTLIAKLNGNSNKPALSAADEFVLDILNDDLIARVRSKINSGSKELFEPCVKAVKAFLAGEPFQEFETSMYFHR